MARETQVCLNGHVFTASEQYPKPKFCTRCGTETITNCRSCSSPINGVREGSLNGLWVKIKPSFCENCGNPYPWTVNSREAAYELIDYAAKLNSEEKMDLKDSIIDLIKDTPKTAFAQLKFKKYILKAGEEVAKGLKDTLIDCVSTTVKKSIWGE